MSLLLALFVVSAASLLLRLVPLLGAPAVPDAVADAAGRAGSAVLAALVVRSVLHHSAPGTPHASVLAAVSVTAGLVVARRTRSMLLSVAGGVATYLVVGYAVAAVS